MTVRSISLLLASASSIVMASSGQAHAAPAQAAPAQATPTTSGGAASNQTQTTAADIVVTGSRVAVNGNNAPTPVTIVNTQQLLDQHPGNVSDAINDLPIFSGSRGQNGNPGNGTTNNSGNLQNLRGLGYARTLVLWDGHRLPNTTQDQLVDTDMIPQMLLQRVDVVTGGASAVYGSDAITGVVNFVTDTKFHGLKAQVQQGISQYGDGRTFDGGIAGGTELFGGRGHFEASYEYRDDQGVPYRSDRAWGRQVYTVEGGGTTANPYHLVANTRLANTTFGGLITGADANSALGAALGYPAGTRLMFDSDGTLSPFINGAATGNSGFQSGGSGAYFNASIRGQMASHQAFSRFDYELSDHVKAYISGSYTHNHTNNFSNYNVISGVTISASNPYLPQAYSNALAAAGQSSFTYSRVFADMPRINTDGVTNQYLINGGLSGDVGAGRFKWDLYGAHGATKLVTTNFSNLNNQRVAAALDSVVDPASGDIVCRTAATTNPGCVPLNPFGPTAPSAAALAYLLQPTRFTVRNTVDDIEGTISGSPFDTWAGPLTLALTGEVRHLTYEVDSNAPPTTKADCAGLTTNCKSTTPLFADATIADRSRVGLTVYELAGEAGIPLLSDVRFAKDLSLNLAGRYTYYNTTGAAWTYKAGADYAVNSSIKFRGSYSRDIRAPSLFELFSPSATNVQAFTDLLTGLSPVTAVTTSGNPNLKPEVGKTIAAGIVLTPRFLPGFSASIDYFNIEVSNAITLTQGNNPSFQRACYESGGSSPYCALQTRPNGFTDTSPSNAVTSYLGTYINISKVKTRGFDFESSYSTQLFNNPLSIRAFVTYQPHIIYLTPGLVTIDVGGVAFSPGALQPSPKVRATLFVNYKIGDFSIAATERWRSHLAYTGDPTQYVSTPPISPVAYTNLNLAWDVPYGSDHNAQFFLNIQNLFNKKPPAAASLQGNASVGSAGGFAYGDDPIGRYFTAGFRIKY